MKPSAFFITLVLGLLSGIAIRCPAAGVASPTPENHVYQFMTRQTFTIAPFPTKPGTNVGFLFQPHATSAYLWIPPSCQKVRGVLVLGHNVPEQGLGGHRAIRAVCAEQNLAILYTCPSMRLAAVGAADNKLVSGLEKNKYQAAFLQQILDALATESGYAELRTAPILPMGESMSLLLVNMLTQGLPERCIAGIWIKDASWQSNQPPGVPMLAACGTAAEWEQQTFDIFNRWRDMATDDLKKLVARRTAAPTWPGSLLIEAGSAHFSCTEPMTRLIAQYIRAAAQARLPEDGSPALRPVDLNTGYVAGLSVPGATPMPPKRYCDCTPAERCLPWYFDLESAQAACAMANVNWDAQTQVPVFLDPTGKPLPYNKRGIFTLAAPMEEDGISFTIKGAFLDQLPAEFVKGGTPLTHVADAPTVEWLRGPAIPLGNNRFQIALDRSNGDGAAFFRVWHPGDARYRLSVNPGTLQLPPNEAGKAQAIAFDEIPDQKIGVPEITLHATADSGLPVRFFVKAGPAEIHGAQLVFTPIPVRSKLPLAVTVVAWQWGRTTEPAVQTAPLVERVFHLGK